MLHGTQWTTVLRQVGARLSDMSDHLLALISGRVSALQHLTELLQSDGLLSSAQPLLQPAHQSALVSRQHRLRNGDPRVAHTGRYLSQFHLLQQSFRSGECIARGRRVRRTSSASPRTGACRCSCSCSTITTTTTAAGPVACNVSRRGRAAFSEHGTLRFYVLVVAAPGTTASLRVPHGVLWPRALFR